MVSPACTYLIIISVIYFYFELYHRPYIIEQYKTLRLAALRRGERAILVAGRRKVQEKVDMHDYFPTVNGVAVGYRRRELDSDDDEAIAGLKTEAARTLEERARRVTRYVRPARTKTVTTAPPPESGEILHAWLQVDGDARRRLAETPARPAPRRRRRFRKTKGS